MFSLNLVFKASEIVENPLENDVFYVFIDGKEKLN